MLDSGASEQSLRCRLTKSPVCLCPHSRSDSDAFAEAFARYQGNRAQNPSHTDCSVSGSTVDFGVQQIGHDKKEGGEKRLVNFHTEIVLGHLGESAMGAEWIGQTEAPDFDSGRQLGPSSLS